MNDIIYIHKGELPFYLKLSIKQSLSVMPNIKIHLITDSKFEHRGVFVYPLKDYRGDANKFEEKYIHLSTNTYDFELFCFQRWLVLKKFTVTENLQGSFVYLDSDVFLYSDIFQKLDLGSYKMTVTGGYLPMYSLFKDKDSIIDFSIFLLSYFSEIEKIEYLKNYYNKEFLSKCKLGGVCDMTILGLYSSNCLDLFGLNKGYFNTTIFNFSLDAKRLGFDKNKFNLKAFRYKDKKASIGNVLLHALHFQGDSKILAPRFYTGEYKFFVNFYGFVNQKTKGISRRLLKALKKI